MVCVCNQECYVPAVYPNFSGGGSQGGYSGVPSCTTTVCQGQNCIVGNTTNTVVPVNSSNISNIWDTLNISCLYSYYGTNPVSYFICEDENILVPIPYASTGTPFGYTNPTKNTFTICPSAPIYLYVFDNCSGVHSNTTNPSCPNYGTFQVISNIGTFDYPANTTPYLLNLPNGVTDFTIHYLACFGIRPDCAFLYGHIIPSPSVDVIATNTSCIGGNVCFYYNNPSPDYSYTTTLVGPGTSQTYTNVYTAANPLCINTLTTAGVYTLSTYATFNYANTIPGSSYYCPDTFLVTKTFTVTDCCINTKPNNVIFENATFVNGTATPFLPNTVYSGNISIPNGYVFTGNFTFRGANDINVNCSFSKCDMVFSDGASLNIKPNKQVNFNQSYLHSCGIWQGIAVQDNASVNFKNSVVEDAFAAIQSLGFIFPPLIIHPNIYIENAVFNKNIYGVLLVSSVTSGFTVKNSIFTSRNINPSVYSFVLSSPLPNPPSFNTLISPAYLNPKPPGLTNATSFAYPAFTSKRGQAGIYIIKSGNATSLSGYNPIIIGVARNSNTSPLFENSTTNLFDYLNNGILLGLSSEAYIINNYFQNIFNTTAPVNTGISNGAIYSSSSKLQCGGNLFSSTTNVSRFRNYFTNCLYGTKIDNGANVFAKISNNTFNSCTNGILIEKWQSNQTNLFITNNTSNNTKTFLYSFNNTLINVSVSSNTVTGGNKQIFIDEVLPNNNIHYLIDNNSLTGAYQPIIVNNAQNVYVQNNHILIQKAPPFLTPPIPIQAGVEFNNTHQSTIANNTIKGVGASVDMSIRGIRHVLSQNNQIYCNNIQQVGTAINPEGIPSTALIHSNNLCDATLPRAFYGIFSQFGSFVGNIEGPGSTPAYHVANNNKFGLATLGQFNNDAIFNIQGPANVYYYPNTSSPDYPLVSSLPKVLANSFNSSVCFPPPVNSPFLIISGIRTYINNPSIISNPGKKIGDRNIYKILKEIPSINTISDAVSYLSSLNPTNIRSFYRIDSSLVMYSASKNMSDLNTAESINQSIIAGDSVELLQKQFNAVYIKWTKGDSLITATDIGQMQTIAGLCPFRYGTSVYQARSLLRQYDSTDYVSACELPLALPHNNHRIINEVSDTGSVSIREPVVQVFPNPVKDNLLSILVTDNSEFELYAIDGKLVLRQWMDKTKFNKVYLGDIERGIYLYKIKKDNVVLRMDKLIVQ
ncbi:MAG: hypothetical protein KatS3mg028_1121 [Bacteroidia bacterium]|nr:MAG: hypothetical protein KatS3mg028_1121 [Bacteroidia bacterium]